MTLIVQWVIECYSREYDHQWLSGKEIVQVLNAVGVDISVNEIAGYLGYLADGLQNSILEKQVITTQRDFRKDFYIMRVDDERLRSPYPPQITQHSQRYYEKFLYYDLLPAFQRTGDIETYEYRLNKKYRADRFVAVQTKLKGEPWAIYDRLIRRKVKLYAVEKTAGVMAKQTALKLNQDLTIIVLKNMLDREIREQFSDENYLGGSDLSALYSVVQDVKRVVSNWEN